MRALIVILAAGLLAGCLKDPPPYQPGPAQPAPPPPPGPGQA